MSTVESRVFWNAEASWFLPAIGIAVWVPPPFITITAWWQKMKFRKHFQKHNNPETKTGKFSIPIFQCGSNGSERAGKWGWIKCSSGRGSLSAVERGCLTTARSACPQACGDGCARRTYAIKGLFRRAIDFLSRDIFLLSYLWLMVNFIMN